MFTCPKRNQAPQFGSIHCHRSQWGRWHQAKSVIIKVKRKPNCLHLRRCPNSWGECCRQEPGMMFWASIQLSVYSTLELVINKKADIFCTHFNFIMYRFQTEQYQSLQTEMDKWKIWTKLVWFLLICFVMMVRIENVANLRSSITSSRNLALLVGSSLLGSSSPCWSLSVPDLWQVQSLLLQLTEIILFKENSNPGMLFFTYCLLLEPHLWTL